MSRRGNLDRLILAYQLFLLMLIKIHPQNPNERLIKQVIETLQRGGVIIYPTDTIYGLGCDITRPKAIEKICAIKGLRPEKAYFSFICADLSHISEYTKPITNETFRLLKRTLPGPFTFILDASNKVPKLLSSKKKTVGIRIPDNNITREIVNHLGNPIISTSIHEEDDIMEYATDPELIHEKYRNLVDLVIDGGYGENLPSTVVDCTSEPLAVLRQGKGILD